MPVDRLQDGAGDRVQGEQDGRRRVGPQDGGADCIFLEQEMVELTRQDHQPEHHRESQERDDLIRLIERPGHRRPVPCCKVARHDRNERHRESRPDHDRDHDDLVGREIQHRKLAVGYGGQADRGHRPVERDHIDKLEQRIGKPDEDDRKNVDDEFPVHVLQAGAVRMGA